MKHNQLTRVTLQYHAVYFNRYIRFGHPVHREEPTRRTAYEYYKPGQVFCYVVWELGDYGTKYWRLSVLKAVSAGQSLYKLNGIKPGAEILLDVTGVERVRKAFEVIDMVEALNLDPTLIPPDYYLYVHQMLNTGLAARPYTEQQHQAYRKVQQLVAGETL